VPKVNESGTEPARCPSRPGVVVEGSPPTHAHVYSEMQVKEDEFSAVSRSYMDLGGRGAWCSPSWKV
jgi:hypothetical protein